MGSKRPSIYSLIHFYKRVWTIISSTIMSYISTFSLFAIVICVVSNVSGQQGSHLPPPGALPPHMSPPLHMSPPAPAMDPMMLMLLMSGSGSDSSSLPLMLMMMGGNMDPMMLVLMMSMNTCTEPIKDCIEPNNDHKLICGIVADMPTGKTAQQTAAVHTGVRAIKPCCKCSFKKKGLF